MNWNDLLSDRHLGSDILYDETIESNYNKKEYIRNKFEKDYKRILSCASFRRLQDKTQVFPLDKSDFVRTRLTHSYEVSAIAKTLGTMIVSNIEKKGVNEKEKIAIKNIPDILACAGLIHDIGNTPFGHFGEEIIQKWFETNLKNYLPDSGKNENGVVFEFDFSARYQNDFHRFDGNAQALRLLTKLHFHDEGYGLNLTASVLNTLIKYPNFSNEVLEKKEDGYTLLRKKMGCFHADEGRLMSILKLTGVDRRHRHPLTFILEAADDIAYRTADIEDGLKKGLYTLDELIKFSEKECENYKTGMTYKLVDKLKTLKDENDDLQAMQKWIPYVQDWLMYVAVYRFDVKYASIMNGTYETDLFDDTFHEHSIELFDKIMRKFVYSNREILKLELSANTILTGLLNRFVPAVLYHDKKFKRVEYLEIASYSRLFDLLSDNYVQAYKLALDEFKLRRDINDEEMLQYTVYLRLLLVVDYISGMTDSYAKTLYQELAGIYD